MLPVLMAAAMFAQEPAPVLRHVAVVPAESVGVHIAGGGATQVSGDRLPVVFVPGLLGSAYGFRHVIPDISKTNTVYVIDPLGTGSSSAPEKSDYSLTAQAGRIGEVARALGIRRAIFACHSTGASICYRLAHEQPGLVAGIVSINGGPAEAVRTPGLSFALTFAPLISLFGGEGWARGKVEDGLKKSSVDPAWVTDEIVRGYTAHYRGSVKDILRILKRMGDAKEPGPLAPLLPAIATPVHLLVGAGSTNGAIRAEELATLSTLPALSIDSIHDAGQYIHEERPDAVIDAIRLMSHLATAPPRPLVGRPTVTLPETGGPPKRIGGGPGGP
jgi:pimeloyl-ACP methyl ester carboxylesterase